MQPGKTIIVRNAKIDMFKGFMRLAVDKWGKIENAPDLNAEVNTQNNLSNIEYELVTVNDE
jgi:replication factor A1